MGIGKKLVKQLATNQQSFSKIKMYQSVEDFIDKKALDFLNFVLLPWNE